MSVVQRRLQHQLSEQPDSFTAANNITHRWCVMVFEFRWGSEWSQHSAGTLVLVLVLSLHNPQTLSRCQMLVNLSVCLSVSGRRSESCFSTTFRSRDGFPRLTGNASSGGDGGAERWASQRWFLSLYWNKSCLMFVEHDIITFNWERDNNLWMWNNKLGPPCVSLPVLKCFVCSCDLCVESCPAGVGASEQVWASPLSSSATGSVELQRDDPS